MGRLELLRDSWTLSSHQQRRKAKGSIEAKKGVCGNQTFRPSEILQKAGTTVAPGQNARPKAKDN